MLGPSLVRIKKKIEYPPPPPPHLLERFTSFRYYQGVHMHLQNTQYYNIQLKMIAIVLQSKMLILSTNVDQKSLKQNFRLPFVALQSKTLFLAIFDSRSSIVKSVFDCRLSDVRLHCSTKKKVKSLDHR